MHLAFPLALSLLVLLGLLALRRRPRYHLAWNLPTTPRHMFRSWHSWFRHLPTALLTILMIILIGLIADPIGSAQELYTREESRKILLLIDASSSMEGQPIQMAKSVAETFIRQRPSSDHIGVVLFSDVASGGIMTRNHEGLIKELQRQEGIRISGTQLGVGLFKSLASFIEDAVETALWTDRSLNDASRQQRFQHALDEVDRLGRHLLHQTEGEFIFQVPDIPEPRRLGSGKVLIILSDARVHLDAKHREHIDHRQVFRLYETMGFERLYFISVDALPTHLVPLFKRHPTWRFLRIRNLSERHHLAQAYAEINQLETTRSHLEARMIPQAFYAIAAPALLLLPLALLLQCFPPFRSLS